MLTEDLSTMSLWQQMKNIPHATIIRIVYVATL